ncbi:hypothetical protein LINPERPRIM_LOCUS30839, partial [Linum perenne]
MASTLAKGKSAQSILCCAVWTSLIANFWKERCFPLHGASPSSVSSLVSLVLQEIRYQAL